MPQPKQLSWIQLRVGLLVVISLIIFAVLVFLMTGEGFFARKYTIRTFMDNAGGLRTGDPVRLAGIDVGNVENIRISGSHDPKRAVEVTLRVQRKFQGEIRVDSMAELDAEGLLGQRFINITRGTPGQPVIASGGEVKLRERAELKDVLGASADVMVGLNRVVNRVDRIMESVETGKGSLGKFIYNEELYQKANRSVDDVNRLIAHAASGRGTIGKFLMDDTVYNNTNRTVSEFNQMLADVRAGKGNVGKFLNDDALYTQMQQVTTRTNRLIGDVEQGRGTLGKVLRDEELYKRANSAIGNFEVISARLEKGQGSAGKLLHDEALYNNVNTFTQEMRTLIADFRKNPRKFLTIKFEIF